MAATNAEALRTQIIERYETLSKRLKQVATHAIDHPSDFAFETLSTIAERADVQPSTIVRFAKEFGFDGASAMQRLFRDQLVSSPTELGYRQRVRRVGVAGEGPPGVSRLLGEFVESSCASLKMLEQSRTVDFIERAIEAIAGAGTVYVVGFRRSFAIASYISYALGRTGKRVVLVDGVGGLQAQQMAGAGPGDLLIAISFSPYAAETMSVCDSAVAIGMPIHALTDSSLSPLAPVARQALAIEDAEVRGFRSLLATQLVTQCIVIGYLYAAEQIDKD